MMGRQMMMMMMMSLIDIPTAVDEHSWSLVGGRIA
jgi:hypothetical protein